MICLAFYKSKSKNATLLDKIISYVTHSPYSHVEIVFNSDLFFSSSPRDNGVRYKSIQIDHLSWDFYSFDIDLKIPESFQFCNNQLYKKYDYMTILLYYLFGVKNITDNTKWFCSELMASIIQFCNPSLIKRPPYQYTPSLLLKDLMRSDAYGKQLRTTYEIQAASKIIQWEAF